MNSKKKINVLLVDDRPDGLITLEAVLKCEEYNLVKAGSGREALAALLDHDFAVIILDVQMPEMDGYETASFIKQRNKSKYIPIIFVTAINKDPFFICRGYEVGAVDYLSKPFDPQILRSKVGVFAELFRKNQTLQEQAKLLEASEESKRVIIESARDIISTASAEGLLTSISPAFESITGWKPEEWIGKHFRDLIYPEDLPMVEEKFVDVLNGNPILFETRLIGNRGQRIFVETSAKPLLQQGIIVGAIAVVRDISERKEAEKEKKIRFELERSNMELEQFAHICSHDLQEPLRTMGSFAYLLKEKLESKIDKETDEMLRGLLNGSQRMSFLISDLLEYAHVGSAEVPISPVESGNALKLAIENLRQVIKDNHVKIIQEKLPVVLGNEMLLLQVFQNLISNSIKFRGQKNPQIEISAESKAGEWVFRVKDNGIGFKMEYCDKIFQVFKRLHHNEQYPGTGIGLGICKRIIERQGGRIWAVSEPGKGSSFFFTLLEVNSSEQYLPIKASTDLRQAPSLAAQL